MNRIWVTKRRVSQIRERHNWCTRWSWAKALLTMTAICSLSRSCEFKRTSRLHIRSIWDCVTPSKNKDHKLPVYKRAFSHSWSILPGFSLSLLFPNPDPHSLQVLQKGIHSITYFSQDEDIYLGLTSILVMPYFVAMYDFIWWLHVDIKHRALHYRIEQGWNSCSLTTPTGTVPKEGGEPAENCAPFQTGEARPKWYVWWYQKSPSGQEEPRWMHCSHNAPAEITQKRDWCCFHPVSGTETWLEGVQIICFTRILWSCRRTAFSTISLRGKDGRLNKNEEW